MLSPIINKFMLALLVAMGALILFAPAVSAQTKADICNGVQTISGGSGCGTPAGSPTINNVIKTVVNILSAVVGVAAVVMIIIGGLKYVTSSGDSNNVNSAKNTILYAIIGLIIAVLAQIIVRFVFKKVK